MIGPVFILIVAVGVLILATAAVFYYVHERLDEIQTYLEKRQQVFEQRWFELATRERFERRELEKRVKVIEEDIPGYIK
jgi:uncharacterized protein YxeA